jgi:hypothetical protein
MKTIALVPVRNDAWVLEHSLACWSGFCDVIIVSDQMSTDGSLDVYRRFPKVVVLESSSRTSAVSGLPQQARWRLLDAARNYDGNNLLWCTDADELTPPDLARAFLQGHAADLVPGRVLECRFYNLWNSMTKFRQDLSYYGPLWKPMGFVDNRRVDYPRAGVRPLHEPRMPIESDAHALKAESVPILHLQWALRRRNQLKQAWYRCIDFMDKRMTAVDVNSFYSITVPEWYVHTEAVPAEWLTSVTLPSPASDNEPSWHEREILEWFDQRGVEFFEPLEIWHVPSLRREFRRRTGRYPRPDRSYLPPFPARLSQFSGRAFRALKRRILP